MISKMLFTPDGKTLLTTRAARWAAPCLFAWDLAEGREKGPLIREGHLAHITAMVLSADGSRLATGSADCTAIVWDMARLNRDKGVRREARSHQGCKTPSRPW